MKKFKKIISFGLALTLSFGLIACNNDTGNNDDNGDQEDPDTEVEVVEEEVVVDPENGVFSADLVDYDGGGATLIWHTIGGSPDDLDMVEDEMNEYLNEHMNLSVDFVYHGWDVFGGNMNTIINGGEDYDIAFGSSISGVSTFAQNGMFYDINELIEHAPNLEALIPEELWGGMTLSNGEVFGVPAYKDSAATQYWIWSEKYVDEFDIPIDELVTLEEITPWLETIKEAYPDEYPAYMTRNGLDGINFDFESFAGKTIGVQFGGTTAENIFANEEVQDRFRVIRDWFEAGYINPDASTTDAIPDGELVLGIAQGYDGAEVQWTNGFGLPVVISERFGPVYTSATIQGSYTVINRASDNAEQAIKLIERMNVDQTMRNMFAYGVEGFHYNLKEGTENTIIKTDDADGYDVPAYSQAQFMNMYVVDPQPEDTWTKVAEQNFAAEESELLGFSFNEENVEAEIAALSNIFDKYINALYTGSSDPDEILPAMLEEQEQVGIDVVIEEVQRQIDEFLAGQES